MDPQMKLPWRSAALGCLIVAAASIGALVVVASVKKADVLATVALALAVLAFVAQLVIAIAQGQAANQQLLQSERVNTETQSLLSEIRSGNNELTLTVRQQFDFVLRHALGSAVPHAVKKAGLGNLQPHEMERLENALEASLATPSLGYSVAPSSASEALDYLQTSPAELEAGKAPEIVLSLTSVEVIALQKIAQGELRQLRLETAVGMPITESAVGSRSLLERGLLAQIPAPSSEDNYTWVRLTQGGREIARLILLRESLPGWQPVGDFELGMIIDD